VRTTKAASQKKEEQTILKERKEMPTKKQFVAAAAVLSFLVTMVPLFAAPDDDDYTKFNMVVSAGAKTCLPNAKGTVRITPAGSVEVMDVIVEGLPAKTGFDFFVIQVPKAPLASPGIRATSRLTKTAGPMNVSSGASV